MDLRLPASGRHYHQASHKQKAPTKAGAFCCVWCRKWESNLRSLPLWRGDQNVIVCIKEDSRAVLREYEILKEVHFAEQSCNFRTMLNSQQRPRRWLIIGDSKKYGISHVSQKHRNLLSPTIA